MNKDITGVWLAKDGAKIDFHKDGTFYTENLLCERIFPNESLYTNKKINESGEWELVMWQGQLVIDLLFPASKSLPKGYHTRLHISGSKGIFENIPPWYLFIWEGEEGGNRYKFTKEELENH